MHLKQLKLSGFKSFVDPTIVPFSSQLVAVVGPNGCGKSNIIDAVRWVMGEGSAKTLRGESMADVIFNGSSQRKSVGQASVELVFDNRLGRLTGQYASYQEIAIKRVVTRDGDSNYYLNGSRCRRRDITDLFLGTGAGTRGYSIIGQNTISQLIEAKPDDLRAYFEEAAGVSKYKERRRETQLRMAHTRENLARVDDIRGELITQLQRLERQAKAAERYKALKSDERNTKGQVLALKWQGIQHQQEANDRELNQLSLMIEQQQAKLAQELNQFTQLEMQWHEAQERYTATQTQFYQVGSDVTRLQDLKQQQMRDSEQVKGDLRQLTDELQTIEQQLQRDAEAERVFLEQLQAGLLARDELHVAYERAQESLQVQLQREVEWDQRRQDLNALLHQAQRDVQVESVHLQHVLQREHEAQLRLEAIQSEQLGAAVETGEDRLDALRKSLDDLVVEHQQALLRQEEGIIHGNHLRDQLQQVERQLRATQDRVQVLVKEHARLQTSLQEAMRGCKTGSLWHETVQHAPRLLELITVQDPWRRVCEWVLGESLQAVALESLDAVWPELARFAGQSAVFVTPRTGVAGDCARPCLLDTIQGFQPAWLSPLEHVFLADSLDDAKALVPDLEPYQSVVTSDGVWLGSGWLRFADFAEQDEMSLLLRKTALEELESTLTVEERHAQALQQDRERLYGLNAAHEHQQQQARQTVTDLQQAIQQATGQLQRDQQAIEQERFRQLRLADEQDALVTLLETLVMERLRIDEQVSLATKREEDYAAQWQALLLTREEWDEALASVRLQAEESRDACHRVELQCERQRLSAQQLATAIQRENARRDNLIVKRDQWTQRLLELTQPEHLPDDKLEQALNQHRELEEVLIHLRQEVDELQQALKVSSQASRVSEQQLSVYQEQKAQLQVLEQTLTVRAGTLRESAIEWEIDLPLCCNTLTKEDNLDSCEQKLLALAESIKRLGAVNLVAIEEYQLELARKSHLDEQYQDLNEALDTLTAAIATMDQETQARMQETFDQVNGLFQALFPRLFGGGQARLQLTCDNLLEAGIMVMAQPPGKRNSTIQLLSGGEKAMTAVALVFAIFQLNPSPFCMLDEVDAPLDDLNVGRFCDLVKEMSQHVQFLLITHNKVTMGLADHLIGVTMREPGVSRIVAVDVEQALQLTES